MHVCPGHRFEEVIQQEDFLTTNFNTLMKIITFNKPVQSELLLFKAAWGWLVADDSHSKHLDDIIKVVKVRPAWLHEHPCQ